jgi:hypothetical protein
MHAYEMTELEYVAAEEQYAISEGTDLSDIPSIQRGLWANVYKSTVQHWPRDADIPLRVLRSLHPCVRNEVIRTNTTAETTWFESLYFRASPTK